MCIKEDFQYKAHCFYNKSDFKSTMRVVISDGSSAVILYRIARFFLKIKLGFIGYLFVYLNKVVNGCVIGRRAEFGKGFVIMHPQGVVINGAVKAGEKVVIESGVVIGSAKNGYPVKVPTLGDDVFIGSGAKVLGDITVGNHTRIGANAVVVRNVPDGATVVGIPARVVSKKSDVE